MQSYDPAKFVGSEIRKFGTPIFATCLIGWVLLFSSLFAVNNGSTTTRSPHECTRFLVDLAVITTK
jgi:hypothetical protein